MKRLRRIRRWFARKFGFARLICLALLVGFAVLRIADPAPVEEIRLRTFDSFQRFDPRVKTARPVTIIDINERSLAKFGQWPWPRTRIADMIAELTRLGGVAIGFDIMFAEADRLNPDIAADTFRNLDDATRDKLRALPSNDRILADTMRHSPVVLGETGRRPAAVHVRISRLSAQYAGSGSRGPRPRPAHDQSRTRRHRAAGADD